MKTNTQQRARHNKQHGMTLIEIMIAITLSLLLLGGLIQMVAGNKQTYRVQDAMARVQENGRFSLHFLTKDIRMAGFMGCSNITGGLDVTNNVEPSSNANGYDADIDGAIQAFDGTSAVVGYSYTTGALPTELSDMGLVAGSLEGNVMANTDLLFIRRATSCNGADVVSDNGATLFIASNASCNIQQNDILMVTNCETADIFGVSSSPLTVTAGPSGAGVTIAHGANWNDDPIFGNGYGADSFILKMKSMIFYIGVGESGEPALFKRELILGAMESKELVEGVEGMTILYGVDTDDSGTADIYTTSTAIGASTVDTLDMESVVSVRITAGIRTLENNIATTISADDDYRVRRNFTTTIGIRNRIS